MFKYGIPALAAIILTFASVAVVKSRTVHASVPPPSAPPATSFSNKVGAVGLVEAASENDVPRLGRVRITTSSTLRREQWLRGMGRALVFPVLTIWRNRGLIRVMVRRDILGRYRGSFGGAFWTIINPLLLMLTYFFVFGVVLRDRYDPNASWSSFALYFLAGMLPWLAFSEAAGRSPSALASGNKLFVDSCHYPTGPTL